MKRRVRNRRRQEFVRARLVKLGYDVWRTSKYEWYCAIRHDRIEHVKDLVRSWIAEAATPQAKAKAERQLQRLEENGTRHIVFMAHHLGNPFNSQWGFCSWKAVAEKLLHHGNSAHQFILVQDW